MKISFYDPDENPPKKTKQSDHIGFTLEWTEELGWKENPFTLPGHLLAGMEEERKEINLFFVKQKKFGIIQAGPGYGKTTLMFWLKNELTHYKNIYGHYLDAQAASGEGFLQALADPFKGLFSRHEPKTGVELCELIIRKAKGKYVLLVDNAQKLTAENLEVLGELLNIDCSIILATTHKIDKLPAKDELELKLAKRSGEEYAKILQDRIERAGGQGIKPFTKTVIARIAKETDNTREFLDLAQETAINIALKRANLDEEVPEEVIAEDEEQKASKKRSGKKRQYDELIESLTEGME